MKHSHDDDRLTFGCDECAARVAGDQFWARVHAESSEDEDVEFGMPPSMTFHLMDTGEEDDANQHMRYIPNWMLRCLLDECGQSEGTIADYAMIEAASRLPSDNGTRA